MAGKLIAIVIALLAIGAAVSIYYLQVYHFYEEVEATGHGDVVLTHTETGQPEPIIADNFRGIDADSSPIRYRACFDTTLTLDEATATYAPYEGAQPRNAPGWFDCFDSEAIGLELDAGTARAFTSIRNLEFGIDRVVAITEDGRGYVWHEINECGDKAYDGTPLGKDCPPRN